VYKILSVDTTAMEMTETMRPATIAMPTAVAHPRSVPAVELGVMAAAPTAAVLRVVALRVPVRMAAVLKVLAHALQHYACLPCLAPHCLLLPVFWVAWLLPGLAQRLVRVVPTSGQTELASPPRRSLGRHCAAASARRPVDSPQSPSCNNLRWLRVRRLCEYQTENAQGCRLAGDLDCWCRGWLTIC
jgi:hypothetical protein